METCCQGEDESGRTTAPDDLWGNEEGETNILHVGVINPGVDTRVRGVAAANYQAQVQLPLTPTLHAPPSPTQLDTGAENRGTFPQMTRPDRLKVGRVNSRGHCLP